MRPPLALTLSRQICIASNADLPPAASPPLSAMPRPIVIGSAPLAALETSTEAATTAAATKRRFSCWPTASSLFLVTFAEGRRIFLARPHVQSRQHRLPGSTRGFPVAISMHFRRIDYRSHPNPKPSWPDLIRGHPRARRCFRQRRKGVDHRVKLGNGDHGYRIEAGQEIASPSCVLRDAPFGAPQDEGMPLMA